ncbi:MAG: UDP-glucose 4-epimerase GalE [Bacteroidota bacterium]|nr:UDP-glucose 4-epimerase GalE [Bacteroidota bacterium]
MQTIIVTGGAGYIGSHTIIELLTKTNYNVISIDNFSNSTAKSYQRIKEITNKSFESLDFDLCNENQLVTQLSKIKNIIGIIHFAAYKSVPESVTNPLLYYINNLNSLNNLLKFAQEQKIENFIFSSSCSVYGNAENLPVTEETPLKKAESSYGHTKQIGEDIINFVCKANPNFNAVLLRYFNPVGAHPSGKIGEFPLNRPNNLVPIITQTAVGKNSLTVFGNDFDTRDGSCIRDYIHVSDIADAHVKALNYLIERKNKNNVSLFNLGTGNGVSVLEAIKSFEKVSGKKLNYTIGPRREGDVVAIYANNNLAKKELNWNPEFSLDDMMLSAWKWQLNLEAE